MKRPPAIALAVLAAATLAVSVGYTVSSGGAGRSATFPNAYLPANGGIADLRIVRSATTQAGPVVIDGVTCWQAYQCMNRQCPGLVNGLAPVVFPYDYAATNGGSGPYPHCPRCVAKAGTDPTMIVPYLVEEAQVEMASP